LLAEASPPHQRSLAIAIGLSFLPLGGFAIGLPSITILPAASWQGLFAIAGGTARLLAVLMLPCSAGAALACHDAEPSLPAGLSPTGLAAAGERRNTIGLWGAFFFKMLLYYAVFSWVPAALAAVGLPGSAGGTALLAFAIAGLLTRRFGSRAAIALSTGLLGTGIIGTQSILDAVCSHVYGAGSWATGTGLAVGWGRIGAIASSYIGAAALDRGGAPLFFVALAVAAVLTLGFGLMVSRPVLAKVKA
jgi:AAHS family 4-hydroxybenzoate transporter-like MFS transporter